MKKADRNGLLAFALVVLIGCGMAVAGSQGGASAFGIPVFAFSVGLAFIIQWLAFIPAFALQSERFYDLTGSFTYISVTAVAVALGPVPCGSGAAHGGRWCSTRGRSRRCLARSTGPDQTASLPSAPLG